MSVSGGGGGKKIPPGGAQPPSPRVPTNPKGTTSTTGPKAPVQAEPAAKAVQEEPKEKKSDAFEGRFKSTGESHKIDDAFATAHTPSGIENLVRMLEAARNQLASEHRGLREQAAKLVERLVQAGFSPAQLEKTKQELLELRKKMAALRKRLQHLQRRLKTAFASAGKTGDAQFARLLGAQLDKLRKLEPGLSRALLMLQSIEQAYGTFADGSTPVLRLPVGEHASAEVGNALALLSPGAAISRATLALVREGSGAKLPAAPAVKSPPVLDSFRALVDALSAGDREK